MKVILQQTMEDLLLDEIEKPYGDVNEHNLISKIFIHPKQTIQYVLDHCPDKYVNLFLVVAGIINTVDRIVSKSEGASSIFGLVILGIFLGAIFGKVGFYIYSLLLHLAGNWLKGNADADKFIIVIAWACVPTVCSLPILAFEIVYFGNDILADSLTHSAIDNIVLLVLGVLEIILGIWSLVILVAGVAQVQKFSNIKAIANVVLAGCIVVVPIIIIFALIFAAR